MPFTPIHMGPGILIKGLLQGSFSLMVFGWAQIVMDLQPLFVMITGEGHLHGFSHTYVGAALLAVFSALTGKYLSGFGLWVLKIRDSMRMPIAWWVVFLSAFIGTFSHVFLDSVMHADVQPYYPFNLENPLWRAVSMEQLHRYCMYSGLLGAAVFYAVQGWHKLKATST